MSASLYNTVRWRVARVRALQRDANRCTVGRLLGGSCSSTLHVHHLTPVAEGGAMYDLDNLVTACGRHHRMLEALRSQLLRSRVAAPPRCPHHHRTREAREQCEARLARRRGLAPAA